MIRRFRYAPTPSRHLHVGNGLAALLCWAHARAAGGQLVLRIEDIDRARCRPEFDTSCLEDLRWLGIDWDEGPDVGGPFAPYRQSDRIPRYDAVLTQLVDDGWAYICTCSRRDVRDAQTSAPHRDQVGPGGERPYPGTCHPHLGAPPAVLSADAGGLRFNTTRAGSAAVVEWADHYVGACVEDVRESCGDFLLGRPGQPTYQLAVVADDVAMGITDVVRGRDLIGSTARQILFHRHLDQRAPRFAHHPLIVGPGGAKLSKRDEALSLRSLRASGVDVSALRAALGRAIGLFGPSITRAEPIDFVAALASPRALEDGPLPRPTGAPLS